MAGQYTQEQRQAAAELWKKSQEITTIEKGWRRKSLRLARTAAASLAAKNLYSGLVTTAQGYAATYVILDTYHRKILTSPSGRE